MSPGQEEPACPECGTTNAVNSRFCESCGLKLIDRPTPKARRRAEPEDPTRREIERAVGRARTKLKSVRVLFIVLSGLGVLGTVLLWIAASENSDLYPAVAIGAASTALLIAATVFLFDHPLFWLVSVASLYTVATVLSPGLIGILICMSLWGALPVVLNVTRLQKEHPDLVTANRLRHRELRGLSETSEARIKALRATRRREAVRSYVIVAAVLVVGGLVVFLVPRGGARARAQAQAADRGLTAGEEQQYQGALSQFERVWDTSDSAGVRALGSSEFVEQRWPKVEDILRRRGWSEKYPSIEFETTIPGASPTVRQAWFTVTPKGQLKTHWDLEEDRWQLRRIVFSRTK